MTATLEDWEIRMIVMSNVVKLAESRNVECVDDDGYRDMMTHIEGQVQRVLRKRGVIDEID